MTDQRVAERVPADRRIVSTVNGVPHLVYLYDLSHDGCMITAPGGELDVGDALVLEFFDGLEMIGKVIWRDLGHVGVLFETALHPVVVLHLGWQQPSPSFASRVPTDRFGRSLPGLGQNGRAPFERRRRPRPRVDS
jgi:hypothetical protein